MLRNQPWDSIFLAGFIAYISIRGKFEKATKDNPKDVVLVDWSDRILMAFVFLGNLLIPLVYLFTWLLAFADYKVPAFVPSCGSLVMVFALWLFWRAHSDLGKNWSVSLELRKGHQLITEGVYRKIRHPMYAAIWLFGLGQAMLLHNWFAGWSALVSFALMYFVRAPREERMMSEQFGSAYRDYMRRTGRLFPRLKIWTERSL